MEVGDKVKMNEYVPEARIRYNDRTFSMEIIDHVTGRTLSIFSTPKKVLSNRQAQAIRQFVKGG